VRVSLSTYRGRRLLDVRKFFDVGNDGKLVPTKKGISLRVEDIPELQVAIRKAKKALAAERAEVDDKPERKT